MLSRHRKKRFRTPRILAILAVTIALLVMPQAVQAKHEPNAWHPVVTHVTAEHSVAPASVQAISHELAGVSTPKDDTPTHASSVHRFQIPNLSRLGHAIWPGAPPASSDWHIQGQHDLNRHKANASVPGKCTDQNYRYEWDEVGRLVRATRDADADLEYTYDASDTRVRKSSKGRHTVYALRRVGCRRRLGSQMRRTRIPWPIDRAIARHLQPTSPRIVLCVQ